MQKFQGFFIEELKFVAHVNIVMCFQGKPF